MIVSHRHRFVSIKAEKTAGTSLEIALSEFCGPDDIITPITPNDEAVRAELGFRTAQNYHLPLSVYTRLEWAKLALKRERAAFKNHDPATKIRRVLSDAQWDGYFKFVFERNPWDKVLSYYHHLGGDPKFGSVWEFMQSGRGGRIRGFELYTVGGVPVVDRIYKHEERAEALAELTERLGLPKPLKMPSYKAKGGFRKDRRSYREVLTDREAELIADIYAREIRLLGYTF